MIIFILHHIFNGKWYKTIFHGKYSVIKMIYIVIDFLLLINVIILVLSGISMSEILPFRFMPLSLARLLHMVLAYWGFILIAIHLGLYSQIIIKPIKKKFENSSSMTFITVPYCITALGIMMFIKNRFISVNSICIFCWEYRYVSIDHRVFINIYFVCDIDTYSYEVYSDIKASPTVESSKWC